MKFAGRVAFITGASRGVGKCIALALAKEGCHVVAAAKTEAADARLPGTIYETAAEVEKLGVRPRSTSSARSTFSSTTPARCTGAGSPRAR
jgi:NAD(P)-dependent dehydrogenase (short-subunit alcohol dehydrogenase family)